MLLSARPTRCLLVVPLVVGAIATSIVADATIGAAAAPVIARRETAISMIGDSLTAASTGAHAQALVAAGWSDASISAVSSRGVRTKASADPHTGLTAVDALRSRHGDTTAWVVALGTNDAGIHPSSRYADLIRDQLDRIGANRRVLWVDVYLPRNPARQRAWNAALEQVRQERPAQLVVFSWSTLAAAHPEWLSSDGVHYTPAGTRARAEAIAAATATLRRQPSTWGREPLARSGTSPAPIDTDATTNVGSGYVPLDPTRVLDTRDGRPVAAGAVRVVELAGHLPSGATAAAVNLTVAEAAGAGHVQAWACGTPAPGTSVANVGGAEPVAAGTVVALDDDARMCVRSSVDVELVVDLAGAFVTGDGLGLAAVTPARVHDSRVDGGRIGPGEVRRVPVGSASPESVADPASVGALVVKLAATDVGSAGYLTVWSCASPRPATSALNVTPDDAALSNTVHVTMRDGDDLCLASTAEADVVVDVVGRYTASSQARLHLAQATRVLDTRDGTGGWSGWLPAGAGLQVPVTTGPVTVLATLTATAASGDGYLVVHPAGTATPAVSALDASSRRASAGIALVPTDSTGAVAVASATLDGADVMVDVLGWFA